eukprot:SAG22_NODE_209_length_15177_cov_9.282995_13_plen_400_part_00
MPAAAKKKALQPQPQPQLFPASPPTVVKKRRAQQAAAAARAATTATAAASLDFGGVASDAPVPATYRLELSPGAGGTLASASWEAAVSDMEAVVLSMEHRHGGADALVGALRKLVGTAAGQLKLGEPAASSRVTNLGKLHGARRQLCERFSAECGRVEAAAHLLPEAGWRLPKPLLPRLLDRAYSAAVTQPKTLNKYKPFSHEVYGETNCGLTDEIITGGGLGPDDVFFDLGSGVGQVVLQAAAATGCRAYGIELMPAPAGYQVPLRDAFETELQAWGYSMRQQPQFVHGSFLDADPRELPLPDATFIFVNNYAFPVALSHRLGARIAELCKPGTKIVSYKPLAPLGRTRNKRAATAAGGDGAEGGGKPALVEQSRAKYMNDGVSWTSTAIDYIRYELR